MKKIHKSTFFIVVAFIALFAVSTITGFDYFYGDNKTTVVKGVDDIRLGIDIQGGVDVTFAPADGYDATDDQLDAATEIIKTRLSTLGINDNEIYSDPKSDRIIVRFPWQAGESEYDAESAVKELGEMAELTFRRGSDYFNKSAGFCFCGSFSYCPKRCFNSSVIYNYAMGIFTEFFLRKLLLHDAFDALCGISSGFH